MSAKICCGVTGCGNEDTSPASGLCIEHEKGFNAWFAENYPGAISFEKHLKRHRVFVDSKIINNRCLTGRSQVGVAKNFFMGDISDQSDFLFDCSSK